MNAELVKVGDVLIGKDGKPMKVLDVEHVYQGDGGSALNLRQILITMITVESTEDTEPTVIPAKFRCRSPAPDGSARTCDKSKGHAGQHWTFGGNTLTWRRDD